MTDDLQAWNRMTCPECFCPDVTCVAHPTAKGWHVFHCQECGHEGGDHRGPPP